MIRDVTYYGAFSVPVVATVTSETWGTGTGAATTFTGTAASPQILPGSLTVTAGIVSGTDNYMGVISGTGVTGTINYTTGVYSLTYTSAVASGTKVTAAYTGGCSSLTINEVDYGVCLGAVMLSGKLVPSNVINQASGFPLENQTVVVNVFGSQDGSSWTPVPAAATNHATCAIGGAVSVDWGFQSWPYVIMYFYTAGTGQTITHLTLSWNNYRI